MNGSDGIKKAAIEKAKKVASAASSTSNGSGKKRKTDLKPIITTEQQAAKGANPYR
jgi:serine/threonine-protein kinase SRPK3